MLYEKGEPIPEVVMMSKTQVVHFQLEHPHGFILR